MSEKDKNKELVMQMTNRKMNKIKTKIRLPYVDVK